MQLKLEFSLDYVGGSHVLGPWVSGLAFKVEAVGLGVQGLS